MGLLRHLVFENPTTLWVLMGIGAAISVAVWRKAGSERARAAAVAFIVGGVLVGVLAWAVETDHEHLVRTIDTMSAAAGTGRADVFVERISPLYASGTLGKDDLSRVVRLGLEQVRATAEMPTITEQDGQATVTQAYVFRAAPGSLMVVPPQYERVVWEGVFAPDPDGEWRLRSAVATSPRRMAPEQAVRYLPRGDLRP
jgi:hypothetical protein